MQTNASSQLPSEIPSTLPIERRALHEEVAERLREMITEGLLAPGSRLNERVLCERLGVSRTPLREAFKVLAAERLVELNPNRGAIVATLSADDVEHLFELMAALEGLSGELAARRRTAAELDEIRAMHYEMLAAHARRDLPLYYRLNRGIHEAINRAARNPELTETYDSVNLRIQNLRFRSNFNQEKWEAAVREHGAMIDALAAGDAPALRAVLERHLRHKRDAVLEELRAAPASAQAMAAD
jgi:DNA-binding GntR family transcriptional regulator